MKGVLRGEGRDGGGHQRDATVSAVKGFVGELAEWRAHIAAVQAVSALRSCGGTVAFVKMGIL